MRETPNLLLKLPDPTDYVLVEDLNENFTKLDTEIAKITDEETGVEAKLTKHLGESTVGAHKASNISFTPPTDMTSTNLQLAVVEAFRFGNSRKKELVDLLLSLDDSLQINYNSTWQQIYAEAANISTGKEMAAGTITSAQTQVTFEQPVSGTTSSPYVAFDTTGLDFIPSVIYFISANKDGALGGIWFRENNFISGGGIYYANSITGTGVNLRAPFTQGIMNIPLSTSNKSYEWVAYSI